MWTWITCKFMQILEKPLRKNLKTMCCSEHCVLSKTDKSQNCTPGTTDTLYINKKFFD